MSVAAVLTAAGSGSRLGHRLPKGLVPLGGEPLVLHAARGLLAARTAGGDRVGLLVVTAPADRLDDVRRELSVLGSDAVTVLVVPGGPTRQASVAAALSVLADRPASDIVLVHDAARPLAPASLVERVVEAVRAGRGAVVPGLPVTDTVKQVAAADRGPGPVASPVVATVDRTPLRAVQTPQGFTLDLLRRAHAAGSARALDEASAASDDAGLVERLGEPVWVVDGDERAAKVTTARDLAVAEMLHRRDLAEGQPVPGDDDGPVGHAALAEELRSSAAHGSPEEVR